MSPEPVATWVCRNTGCRQKDVEKYAYTDTYENVLCGACGQPCTKTEPAPSP